MLKNITYFTAKILWKNYFYFSLHSLQPCTILSPWERMENMPKHKKTRLTVAYFTLWLMALQESIDGELRTFNFSMLPHTWPTPRKFLFLSANTGVLPQFFNFSVFGRNLCLLGFFVLVWFGLFVCFKCVRLGHLEVPGQGLNLSHSCDLHHSSGNAGSFKPLSQVRGRTIPLQWPQLLQQLDSKLHCSRNSSLCLFN